MNVGHLRKLIAGYDDETELLVEIQLPEHVEGESDMWHTDTMDGSYVRGEVVPNNYMHVGGGGIPPIKPRHAILEVTFSRFNVSLKRKEEGL